MTATCSIDGCLKKSRSRGWCKTHYCRFQRHGDPLVVKIHFERWTEAEDQVIRDNIEHNEKRIHRMLCGAGFSRSLRAVRDRLDRMRLRTERTCYNPSTLSLMMGVSKSTIQRWIKRGWLRATRRIDDRIDHQYLIEPKDLRRFIKRYPNAFSIERVDQTWFLDLIFQGELYTPRPEKQAKQISSRKMDINEFGYPSLMAARTGS